MATDYEICLQRNKERERTVPESVLQEMYQRFAPPHESEGWDEIEISAMFDVNTYNMERLSESLDFDQKNHHHSFALREHLQHTKDYVKTKTQDSLLTTAAILHDIGKLKTQTIDENGEAHYYNHQSVGAYDSIFYLIELAEEKLGSVFNTPAFCDNLLEISNLIYYHMHPYLSWKQSEKAKEKDRALLGEEMFNKIMLLHEADVAAH